MKFPCGCKVDAVRVISHPNKEALPMVYPCKEHEEWFAEKAGDGTFLQGKEEIKSNEIIQLKAKLLDELLASQSPGGMLRILRRAAKDIVFAEKEEHPITSTRPNRSVRLVLCKCGKAPCKHTPAEAEE